MAPTLELPLSREGFASRGEGFGVDEGDGLALGGEAAASIRFVAEHAGSEVFGDACVVLAVCALEDVLLCGRIFYRLGLGGCERRHLMFLFAAK